MTITKRNLFGGNFGDAGGNTTRDMGTVTTGDLVVGGGMKFTEADDPFVLADFDKSAGTATLTGKSIDIAVGGNTGGTARCYIALWSAIVSAGGTLTVGLTGDSGSNSYILVGAESYGGSWDASRVHATNNSGLNTGNSISSLSSGSVTAPAAGGLAVGVLSIVNSLAATITEEGGTGLIYEQETVDHQLGSMIDKLIGASASETFDWTFTALNGDAPNGGIAGVVLYKEAAGGGSANDTISVAMREMIERVRRIGSGWKRHADGRLLVPAYPMLKVA